MPLYHFHVWDAGELLRDDEGTEFLTREEAHADAVRMFGELLLDKEEEFWGEKTLRVEVTDSRDVLLFTLGLTGMQGQLSDQAAERIVPLQSIWSTRQ